jgi:hypothetical protein
MMLFLTELTKLDDSNTKIEVLLDKFVVYLTGHIHVYSLQLGNYNLNYKGHRTTLKTYRNENIYNLVLKCYLFLPDQSLISIIYGAMVNTFYLLYLCRNVLWQNIRFHLMDYAFGEIQLPQ